MNVFSYLAFGVSAALLAFLLKSNKSPVGQIVCAVACVLMAARLICDTVPILSSMDEILDSSGFYGYGKTLIKALGVAAACETTGDVCRELGESSLASRIELAGKLEIVALSLPLAKEILEAAGKMVAL